jgi:hypothetical protein
MTRFRLSNRSCVRKENLNTTRTHLRSPVSLLGSILATLCLLAARPASAVMVTWEGTNGVSANVYWSSAANWYQINTFTEISPVANAANFTWTTATNGPGITTVNVDGAYGSPGSGFAQSYGAFFGQTNGYHTVVINPGITWSIQASGSTTNNGTQGIGILVGPQPTNNNTINTIYTVSTGATWTNYTTITGSQSALYCDAGANTGGLRVEGASTTVNNHYSILDMSGLGYFLLTNITGLSSSCGFYVVNGGQNSQALVYLALTNVITLNNNFMVGNLGSSSNSLAIGVYLGQSNYITTGANNNTMYIGYTGCTNGFLKFNPNALGGPNPPTAYISGASGSQAAIICSAAGGAVPGYAICDFSGGVVTWTGNTLTMGVSGIAASNTSADGVLNFTAGTNSFNTITVGDQSVSAGATAVGTINLDGASALLQGTTITLGATTGTINPATSGTLNITSGTLAAATITNGGAGSTINLTNANLNVSLISTNVTNITVANFNAAGTTNIINIASIPGITSALPWRFHLINTPVAANLVGASTFGLGTLPASFNPDQPYQGHLDTTTTPGLVDFVLTAGPPPLRTLTWTGTNTSGPDGLWDVDTNYDWLTNGVATFFSQYDLVNFLDVASPAQTDVSLTTTLTPTSITVSNAASVYTLGLSSDTGSISGTTGLTKANTGTLILDNGTSNSFTGGVLISGGILQVGNNDTSGNIPAAAPITNNSVLAFDQTGAVTVPNTISGSGEVVSEGGGVVQLSSINNSFTGNALATNSSTLQSGGANSMGSSNGTIVIASGSTYDPNGHPTPRSIIVSGTGVNGTGAIVNSGGPIYDSATAISPSITLAGDTLFSFPTRWDYGLTTGVETFSTGGNAYNLTLNGTVNNSYFEWRDIAADPALNNITVTAGYFGIVGSTTLGNTSSSSLNVLSGATVKLYNVISNVVITKPVVLNDGSTFYSEEGTNTIAGPLTLTNSGGNYYCVIEVVPTSLTVSGPVSGNGILWMQGSTAPLIITGNASALTGGALISSGLFGLYNVLGSGITNASGTTLFGNGTAEGPMDVSGVFVPGASNVVGTFTAAGGLILEGSSAPVMNLTATTGVGGVYNSLIAVTGNLTVNGSPIIYINPIGTLCNGTYTLMTYTGTLSGTFGGVQTVASSAYTLTLETNTPGEVQMMVTGAPVPGKFVGPFIISGTNLTLTGTGGTINGTYRVFTSTNIATPLKNWTEVGSGMFDGSGNFSFPATFSTNGLAQFFILEEP